MYLMGQAFFSAQLMQAFKPRSVESVALVTKDDSVLRPLFVTYEGMRVVACPSACHLRQPEPRLILIALRLQLFDHATRS
jgi:hypothetical protein